MKDLAVTVKKTRKPIEIQHYIDYLKFLKPQFNIQNVNIEDTRGYHLHFIIKSDTDINYKDLYPSKYGWNVKAIPIYNREGWVKYCEKDLLKNLHNRRILLQQKEYEPTDTEIEWVEECEREYELKHQRENDLTADEQSDIFSHFDWIPPKRILFKTD